MTLNTSREANADFLSQPVNLLLFRLGRQTFALTIEHIVQIIPMLKLTPVPQVEQIIEGVANIHGKVTPILNARRCLGMPEIPFDLDTPIILCEASGHSMGLIVDEVLDVTSILESQIAPTQSLLPNSVNTARSISGVVYQGERMILLLSPEFLLNPGQVRALNQVIDALPSAQPEPDAEPVMEDDLLFIEEPAGDLPLEAGDFAFKEAFPGSHDPSVTGEWVTEAADAQVVGAEGWSAEDGSAEVTDLKAEIVEPAEPEAAELEAGAADSILPPNGATPQPAEEAAADDSSPDAAGETPSQAAPRQNGKRARANGKRSAKQASAKQASVKKTSASSRDEVIAGHLAELSLDMPPADCNPPDKDGAEDPSSGQTGSDD